MSITSDPDVFTVGSRAVVTCSSDTGVADRIEWVSGAGLVLVSGTSVRELELPFNPVNDSLHGSEVTCSVTRDEGSTNQTVFSQTLSISVRGGCGLYCSCNEVN